jgi:large subunit ribosomal protein L10
VTAPRGRLVPRAHGGAAPQRPRVAAPDGAAVGHKNSDVAADVAGTRWEAPHARTWGVNAWLFVRSDEIPPALKPYLDFQKEWKLQLNDFTGAVYEGRLYGPDDFAKLEAMPARAQSSTRVPPRLPGRLRIV